MSTEETRRYERERKRKQRAAKRGELVADYLAKPTDAAPSPRSFDKAPSSQIDISGNTAELQVNGPVGTVNEGTALTYLTEEGLDPAEWEAISFRKIKYGVGMESVKVSYKRVVSTALDGLDLNELINIASKRVRGSQLGRIVPGGDMGYIVALGDTQFGKIDGDGVEGALTRCIEYLEQARADLDLHRLRCNIGHVHLAFLGDHIEGFTSQGGANTWRTQLTLNEQIRLTRRVMMHAVKLFSGAAARVTVVAVPGNHGRVVTANGSQTRYDDSHDTESLIAVSEACELAGGYEHVEFYVPRTDEIAVTVDVAGTRISHVHGDRWSTGKHFEWWSGQAFGDGASRDSHVLIAGHYHSLQVQEQGDRMFIQVPALEGESTWWRHRKGTPGNPGIVTAITKDGHTRHIEVIR